MKQAPSLCRDWSKGGVRAETGQGTARALYTCITLFSEPSSDISISGSEWRRVAADETTVQTSGCAYNHRGIGSQSVGGQCPAW